MSLDSRPVNINILDKEYLISCTDDEREQLHLAVEFLNDKLLQLKNGGKVIGTERIAVMTALNLASELLQYKHQNSVYNDQVDSTIKRLNSKIEGVLDKDHQLPI